MVCTMLCLKPFKHNAVCKHYFLCFNNVYCRSTQKLCTLLSLALLRVTLVYFALVKCETILLAHRGGLGMKALKLR